MGNSASSKRENFNGHNSANRLYGISTNEIPIMYRRIAYTDGVMPAPFTYDFNPQKMNYQNFPLAISHGDSNLAGSNIENYVHSATPEEVVTKNKIFPIPVSNRPWLEKHNANPSNL
jgi:hypothetical protein